MVKMVDVSRKREVLREARARGVVKLKKETIQKIKKGKIPKGDVFKVVQVAGIMGAKKTAELIPLCHPLRISQAELSLDLREERVEVEARVKAEEKTGVEMEALVAVSVGCLTLYDMCKQIDPEIEILRIYLVEKRKKDAGKGTLG